MYSDSHKLKKIKNTLIIFQIYHRNIKTFYYICGVKVFLAMSSFIKLPRDLFKSEHWQEKRVFSKAEAYIDLLSFAPYKDEDETRKGEFILSRRNMELRWLWSGTKVTNFINELIKSRILFFKKGKNEGVYSFVEYEDYKTNEAKPTEKKIILLAEIQNISEYAKNFPQNKKYLLLVYYFWRLWKKHNENNSTYKNARIDKWYKDIELLIDKDGQDVKRMIAILKFFEKCAKYEAGYDTFWFETIKSVGAFRKVDRDEVYYIDKIADVVNKKIQSSEDFLRLVNQSVKTFNELEL